MNLLVDIGNSRIKWCDGGRARAPGSLHAAVYTRADVGACLDAHWQILAKPESIWVANVAGRSVAGQLSRWTMAHWAVEPQFAEVARMAGGVRNAYADINQLGVDRWLALIATWQKYASAACIVDCGTAVTVDGLDGAGRHLGGLIVPGIPMMRQALYQSASGIPADDGAGFVHGLADNTAQGVITGCTLAVVALIDRAVTAIREKADDKLTCVITGGGAEQIRPLLQTGFVHDPLLVLSGLAVIAGGQT